MSKKSYFDYLRTKHWMELREKILSRDNHSCTKCGDQRFLHVHHLTYARVGHELEEDLVTLCSSCHMGVHRQAKEEKQQKKSRKKRAERRERARVGICRTCDSGFSPKDYPQGGGFYCSKPCKMVSKKKKTIDPEPVRLPSPEEIEEAKTGKGAWTKKTLARWGVEWPPPVGWRSRLEEDYTNFESWRNENELRGA